MAETEVRELASDTGEHANLMVEENGRGAFLYKVKGSRSVRLDTYEGIEVDLHTTAMGKAVLAGISRERRDEIVAEHGLDPVTSETITDRRRLESELDDIHERGYAIDNEERVEGVRCVAAPIVSPDQVVGAVSVSAPLSSPVARPRAVSSTRAVGRPGKSAVASTPGVTRPRRAGGRPVSGRSTTTSTGTAPHSKTRRRSASSARSRPTSSASSAATPTSFPLRRGGHLWIPNASNSGSTG
ncbi:MAG: IclR family transcriptional regulator C-terminal domain-containing protein [Haloarculaceae archaeon]